MQGYDITTPPSPLSFCSHLQAQVREEGLTFSEPVGQVLSKMLKDVRVLGMRQFHQWYTMKLAAMEEALRAEASFIWANVELSPKELAQVIEYFRWT